MPFLSVKPAWLLSLSWASRMITKASAKMSTILRMMKAFKNNFTLIVRRVLARERSFTEYEFPT